MTARWKSGNYRIYSELSAHKRTPENPCGPTGGRTIVFIWSRPVKQIGKVPVVKYNWMRGGKDDQLSKETIPRVVCVAVRLKSLEGW